MSDVPAYIIPNNGDGEMLPVEDITGSEVETWTRAEVAFEFLRVRDRYSLDEVEALKVAVKHVQEVTSLIAKDEGRLIVLNGYQVDGYKQTKLEV